VKEENEEMDEEENVEEVEVRPVSLDDIQIIVADARGGSYIKQILGNSVTIRM